MSSPGHVPYTGPVSGINRPAGGLHRRAPVLMPTRQSPPEPASDAFANDVLGLLEPLYGTAMRLTRNRADAEDLVQDTVVKALRFAAQFTPGSNLKAWVFTILHNTWRNRLRDAARGPVHLESDLMDDAPGVDAAVTPVTPETILLRDTLDADLQAALDGIPEAFREAVWLRDVDELSYAEIAGVLGVPIGTVMSRISRGRRLLFERLTHAPRQVDV
jgi:RNA polymerase sigma-70 factor, ECF subfamily